MPIIDIEDYLREVDSASKTGDDCEYDPSFLELEKKAQGEPERQMGGSVLAAVPPDWKAVRALADELFGRTLDIRVAVHLCRALTAEHGLAGFAAGLEVLLRLLERYWEPLHPRLDPDDDDDPTMRVNIIAGINDAAATLTLVRDSVVVSSRLVGRFRLRDVLAAASSSPPEGTPDRTLIAAAFMAEDVDEDAVHAVVAAAKAAWSHVRAIEAFVTDQVGSGNAVNLSAAASLLREASAALGQFAAAKDGEAAPVEADAADGGAAGVAVPVVRTVAAPGAIASREDVIRALDRICDYYAQAEPASPVPYLLQRAKRLVGKDFFELLRDLTPDGVSQFTTISGVQPDDY